MNMEKMQEVFSDEAFVKGLMELENASEVQVALKEKGLELTQEQIQTIFEFLAKVKGGELPEEMLEQVAGGGFWGSIWKFICVVIDKLTQGGDDDFSKKLA